MRGSAKHSREMYEKYIGTVCAGDDEEVKIRKTKSRIDRQIAQYER